MPAGDACGVLAVHSGALGDVILFGHLLTRLNRPITLIAGGEKACLLKNLSLVQQCLDFDSLPMHELFQDSQISPIEQCRLPRLIGNQYDWLISCFAQGDASAQGRLTDICGAKRADFLPVMPAENQPGSLVKIWGQALGLEKFIPNPPAWPVPQTWREKAAGLVASMSLAVGQYILIHPGSGGRAKCWPINLYMELIDLIQDSQLGKSAGNTKLLVVLGPAEVERWDAGTIKAIQSRAGVIASPSLDMLAGLLANSLAYVGNDSGVSHLSAAIGARTLAIFGPSCSEHFSPIGPVVSVIAAPAIGDITPGQVFLAMRQLLAS
jgi:heptosyltransferase-3